MIELKANRTSGGVSIKVKRDEATIEQRMMELGAIAKYAHDQIDKIVDEMGQEAVKMFLDQEEGNAIN
jgi:hypothetical protein